MKEYTKEFEGVTYKFTESDLSAPFSYVLERLKKDLEKAKKRMGSRYTEEVDKEVQTLLKYYITSSFKFQLEMQSHILRWGQDINPQNALHRGGTIGDFANRSRRYCSDMQDDVVKQLHKIGVPICKQII